MCITVRVAMATLWADTDFSHYQGDDNADITVYYSGDEIPQYVSFTGKRRQFVGGLELYSFTTLLYRW